MSLLLRCMAPIAGGYECSLTDFAAVALILTVLFVLGFVAGWFSKL